MEHSNSSHDRRIARHTSTSSDEYTTHSGKYESPASQISKLQKTKTITGLPSFHKPDKSARQSPRSREKARPPSVGVGVSTSPATMSRSLLRKSAQNNSTLKRSHSEKSLNSPRHRRYATVSGTPSPKSLASTGRKSSIANLLAAVQLSPRNRRKNSRKQRSPSRSPSPGRKSGAFGAAQRKNKHKRQTSGFFRRTANSSPAAPTPGTGMSATGSVLVCCFVVASVCWSICDVMHVMVYVVDLIRSFSFTHTVQVWYRQILF